MHTGILTSLLRVPAIGVRTRVWVAETLRQVGHHFVKYSWVHCCGRLIIEVKWLCCDFTATSCCHLNAYKNNYELIVKLTYFVIQRSLQRRSFDLQAGLAVVGPGAGDTSIKCYVQD